MAVATIAFVGCLSKTNKPIESTNTQSLTVSNLDLYKSSSKQLFDVIDKNDSGELSDSAFKPIADSLKMKVDSIANHLTSEERAIAKKYDESLLEELIQNKMRRDN
jgi:hypothetical protein